MIPETIKNFLLAHNESKGCFCLAINDKLQIIQYYGKANKVGVKPPRFNMPVVKFLPILLTESFDKNFEIPFYNVDEHHVCHIYYIKNENTNYLVLTDKSEIFQVTQKYQQFAHNDNISKNEFKRLADDLSRTQNKLKKSNQEKTLLIAMLSHELGTPLTSILGYTELLMNKTITRQTGLDVIHRNATYLKNMIENTLLFGRSEAGGLQLEIESIAVQNLFNNLKATLLPVAQHKNLELHMFHKGNEIINIDVTRIKQILINLLNNALKYTETGSIELKYTTQKNNYVFSVIDTGIGMTNKQQISIFDPWERIEESSEKGAGIGLYISQKLAQAIGGGIKLKYSSKEFGSIFQLTVPMVNANANEKKQIIKGRKCADKNILVIDDDQDILDLIQAFLQPCGIMIFTASCLKKAVAQLENTAIDIVLTDFHLGQYKASDFIKQIQQFHPQMPIVLMTAMPSETLKKVYKDQGFAGLISKPLHSADLLENILTHLK